MSKDLKDHRQIGKELDLFSFHDVAPGAVFWHDKGYRIYKNLVEFLRKSILSKGYEEISTPVMVKSDLFQQSGHWNFYKEHMLNLVVYDPAEADEIDGLLKGSEETKRIIDDFEMSKVTQKTGEPWANRIWPVKLKSGKEVQISITVVKSNGKHVLHRDFVENYSLKPMNCPEATLVYSTKPRSYRDLPIRLAEFGTLNRNELFGVLGGLFRVRQFTIDDAHHFVRPDQISAEIQELLVFTVDFYKKFGFETSFYLATRPEKAMGDVKLWEKAENDLETALKKAHVTYGVKEKDGAFYGPKIDIHIKDSQDRDWQLATIQLDFQIPEKMKLEYTDSDGKPKRPVMVHRGILGSIERFIGILIEHYQGAFPLWLSPVQVVVLAVSDKNNETAKKVYAKLVEKDVRVELNTDNKTLGNKIREATLQKIPYMIIIGDKESEKSVSVRTREGKDLGQIDLYKFIESLQEKIEKFQ